MSDEGHLLQIMEDDAIHELTKAGVSQEAALGLARVTRVGAWAENILEGWRNNEITTTQLNEVGALENWHRLLDSRSDDTYDGEEK